MPNDLAAAIAAALTELGTSTHATAVKIADLLGVSVPTANRRLVRAKSGELPESVKILVELLGVMGFELVVQKCKEEDPMGTNTPTVTITLPIATLKGLLEDSIILTALRIDGIESWHGWDGAIPEDLDSMVHAATAQVQF
jgi:hypothetical protein